MLPATIFAQFEPLSPSAQLAIISLLAVANIATGILTFFRRRPSLDTDLTLLRASLDHKELRLNEQSKRIDMLEERARQDLAGIYEDIKKQQQATQEKFDSLQRTLAHEFKAIASQLAKLEK